MVARAGQLYRKGITHPKPSYVCACGDHAFARMQKPGCAMVSVEDKPVLDSMGWFLNTEGYVQSATGILARLVARAPKGVIVDHRNHDKQDNRRSNLRLANNNESVFNKKKLPTRAAIASRYKGVNYQCNRWVARIVAYKKRENLGSYRCETAAALAYDRAARRLHGEFAKLNFAGGVSS